MSSPHQTQKNGFRGRGGTGFTRGRGSPSFDERGGRGRGRGRGMGGGREEAMTAVRDAVAESAVLGDGIAASLPTMCSKLVEFLCTSEEFGTTQSEGKNEVFIARVLKTCGDAAQENWSSYSREFEALVRAAPRCCWRPAYLAFLTRTIHAAPSDVASNIAVLDGIAAFCRKIPEEERAENEEVHDFIEKVARRLELARANPQNSVVPLHGSGKSTPAWMYAQQIRELTRATDVLDKLQMPTTEAFLFPPSLASDTNGGEAAARVSMREEMQRLPQAQTWYPISAEQGWYHLFVQFLLLRSDCASGLRNAASQVYQAFIEARLRCSRGVLQSDVTQALQVLRKSKENDCFVRPFWNANWVGVGFQRQHGLVYVMELEMPIQSHKRLLNDNIVLLSKRYFDRQSPVFVGLIRSLPRDHQEQQEKALNSAKGKMFMKRFAFQVIQTLGPAVDFATEAEDGAPFCVVESPVLYSAYNASLAGLKRMLEDSFAVVRSTAWPTSTGMPLEGALLACHTSDPPGYMSTLMSAITVEKSVVVRDNVAPFVDTNDTGSWDSVCQDWSEEEEEQVKLRGKEDPSMAWCHLLDRTQRAALRHIFSHRVALVQGTPGTGKSFVGFKFIQILLENFETLNPGPIMVTAVTNHALDAVLEEVLRYMEATHTYKEGAILRLGSGSKANAALSGKCDFEDFTRSPSREVRAIETNLSQEVKQCSVPLYSRMTQVFPTLPSLMNTILSVTLKRLLPSFADPIGFTSQSRQKLEELLDLLEAEGQGLDEREWKALLVQRLSPTFKAVTADNGETIFKELQHARPYLRCDESNVFDEWRKWDRTQGLSQSNRKRKAKVAPAPILSPLHELQKQMSLLSPIATTVPSEVARAIKHARAVLCSESNANEAPVFEEGDGDVQEDLPSEEDDSADDAAPTAVADIRAALVSDSGRTALDGIVAAAKPHFGGVGCMLALSKEDRELLLDAVPNEGLKRLVKSVKEIAQNPTYAAQLNASNHAVALRMAEQMRRAKIVGGTLNSFLKEAKALAILKPRILLVEEAGQVLEGQLIASLTDGLEHLLLIGDHRQLPPQPEVFELEKKGLGVSLMERLVRSGAPYETLTTQRRMHPEVSQLIHGYYQRVDPRRPVQIEDHPSTWLRPPPQGVQNEMRTLLLSYDPQTDASKQEHQNGDMGSYSNAYEASLCAAIVSQLAFYNPDKSIIVLSYYSEQRLHITRQVDTSLIKSRRVKVRTVDDFQGEEEDFVVLSTVRTERPGFVSVENRACVALSRARMACYVVGCEAVLQRSCGVFRDLVETLRKCDPPRILNCFPAYCPTHGTLMPFVSKKEYSAAMCTQVCNMVRESCGHVCKERCHGPQHNRCQEKVSSVCALCNQVRKYLCYEGTENLLPACPNLCDVSGDNTLCGHGVRAPCSVAHDSSMEREAKRTRLSVKYCQSLCAKVMSCGHVCPRSCHSTTDVNHVLQQKKCDVRISVGHPGCGHMTTVRCGADRGDPNSYAKCREKCGRRLACGHSCSMDCSHRPVCKCEEMITVHLPCGHTISQTCGQQVSWVCREKCTHKHAPCGHACSGVCGECARNKKHASCEPCNALSADLCAQRAAIDDVTGLLGGLFSGASASVLDTTLSGAQHPVAAQGSVPAPSSTAFSNTARVNASASGFAFPTSPSNRNPPDSGASVPAGPRPIREGGVLSPFPHTGRHPNADAPSPRAPTPPTKPTTPNSFRSSAKQAAPALQPSEATVFPAVPAVASAPSATAAPLTGFLRESEISQARERVLGWGCSTAEKEAFLEQELEVLTLKRTLCQEWHLQGSAFTCDVNPEGEWEDLDEDSRETMEAILPLLRGSPGLKESSGGKALDLLDREYDDVSCAPLLRALVYSSKTHIADYRADAAQYLLTYVQQQQQQQRPLLTSLVLVVAGRVYGGSANAPFWSSCVCRARADPAAELLLDPTAESFTLPLKALPARMQGARTDSNPVEPDRWAALANQVSQGAMKTARELEAMIGLETVKKDVFSICFTILHQMNLPPESRVPQALNFILQGNPGTGKTTVARLLGKLLFQMRVRATDTFKETTGEKLAREGSAAAAQLFEDADGGVLFIDEAYALDPKKGGENSSIGMQLLQVAEDKRESLTIILAGYKDDLQTKLFDFNDGFARRFPFTFSFEDFNDAELERVFRKCCGDRKWTANADVSRVAAKRVGRGRGRKGFGNAGAVRVCFEAAYRRATERAKGTSTELLLSDIMGPRPSRSAPPDLALALAELEAMIGLQSVKKRIMDLVELAERNYDLELAGKEPHFCTLNRVFLGNPGTGKTTVAKLYGRILKGLGWLSKGEWVLKQPSDIIKGAVGQSEEAMGKLLAQCEGKLLIIDEAYQLHENTTYGPPTISTLVSKVHGEPGEDIGVVLVGYQKQMETMLRESNPGLKRRFDLSNAFIFEDYSKDELERVIVRLANKKGVRLSAHLRRRVIGDIDKTRMTDNFGNAGTVGQRMTSAIAQMVARDVSSDTLTLGDFGLSDDPPDVEGSLACLDGLYRVDHIKDYVRQMAANIRQREADGELRSTSIVNYVFTGSPGTGKTTVARAMGKVLHCLKCLETDKIVESSGTQMLGSYLGQTKDKVNQLMNDAEGGILFIDEAYSLNESSLYTNEAVTTLVELMTSKKHYQRTVVILAGYTDKMDKLLQMNDGLRSRFTEKLHFPDWGVEDALSFLREAFKTERLQLESGGSATETLRTALSTVVGQRSWGNARSCKTLMDELKSARAKRLGGTREKPKRLSAEDVQYACDRLADLFKNAAQPQETLNMPSACANAAAAAAPATRESVPTATHVQEADESENAMAVDEEKEDVKAAEGEAADLDGDPFFTALLAACKAAGYDSSHERRKALVGVLEATQRGKPLPDIILQPVMRDTGRSGSVVMAALKPQIPTVLAGMRNAVRAQEELDAHMALLAEEERQQRLREREAIRKRLIGLCPAGFQWFEQGSGWRCGGGSHFVSNEQLPAFDV